MENESQSIKKLEQEVEDKKKIYTSLLKENPPLYKIYRTTKIADIGGLLGMSFAVIGLLDDPFLLLLGVVILIVSIVALYRFNKQFDRLFDETASDTLKSARKEYEEYDHRLKEAKEAEKEAKKKEERAKLQENIQRERERAKQMEDEEDDERTGEEIFVQVLTGLYHRELISSHLVYTGDLSDKICKNTFAAQSFLDKAVALVGDIIKIDYDERQKMPYILLGSGHYISSDVCDHYACYFTDPKQIATLEKLQTGNMLTICGVFAKSDYGVPSKYILTQSYILNIG